MSSAVESLSKPAWFCLRTRPKHEHIAAGHLRKEAQLEVYLPRIRFRRKTRQGPVWFTEALFPNYLFARFDPRTFLRRAHHTPGVATVVHFGDQWPTVPDEAIAALQAAVPAEQIHVIESELEPGEQVEVSGGVFHGLKAVVTRVLPARARVAVLLDFLGRQTMVELDTDAVVREGEQRRRLL